MWIFKKKKEEKKEEKIQEDEEKGDILSKDTVLLIRSEAMDNERGPAYAAYLVNTSTTIHAAFGETRGKAVDILLDGLKQEQVRTLKSYEMEFVEET